MILLSQLLHPLGNLEEITSVICRHLEIKVTQSSLTHQLQHHPNYPSLAALDDVFHRLQVETMTLKDCDLEALCQVGEGFLAQVKFSRQPEVFAYVYHLTDHDVYWYNPLKHRPETISRMFFSKLFKGCIMLFDASEKTDDRRYKVHRREEIVKHVIDDSLLFAMPVISILCLSVYSFNDNSGYLWFTICYTLLLLIGYLAGMLLLLYEYDQHSPVVKSLCAISQKTNCAAILHSSASRIWGIPWSVIGTAYFAGVLFAVLVSWFSITLMYWAALLHLFSIPYILYSFYYQYHIAKRWCPLCMCVQAVLLLILICVFSGEIYSIRLPIDFKVVAIYAISIFISFANIYLLWNFLLQYKSKVHAERSLIQIKYRKEVFSTIIKSGLRIEMPSDECGIVLGNPHGCIHIVKVSNPYCHYCAAAQPVLQKLVDRNPEVKLQVIFATDPNSKYYKNTPIDLFLSLYDERGDMEAILSEWYASEDMDLDAFKTKHPLHRQANILRNKEMAEKMFQFCRQVKIKGTPTIFINGYQLPEIYRIKDLLYFI